jgi:hypothetical protein
LEAVDNCVGQQLESTAHLDINKDRNRMRKLLEERLYAEGGEKRIFYTQDGFEMRRTPKLTLKNLIAFFK